MAKREKLPNCKEKKSLMERAVELLNSLEDGDYLTQRQLARHIGCSAAYIVRITKQEPLSNMIIPSMSNGYENYCVSDVTMARYRKEQDEIAKRQNRSRD